jgi:hypothetical protein
LPQFVYDLDKTRFDLITAGLDTYDLDSCRNSSVYNINNETFLPVLSEYNETIKLTICCSLLYEKNIEDTVENVTTFDRIMFAIQGTVKTDCIRIFTTFTLIQINIREIWRTNFSSMAIIQIDLL